MTTLRSKTLTNTWSADRKESRTEAIPASPEATLSAWYDEYGTDILRYCFMFLGNKADAEDATQDAPRRHGSSRSRGIPAGIISGKAGGSMRTA